MSNPRINLSAVISLIFIILLLFALAFLTYFLPDVVTSLINTEDNLGNRGEITESGRIFVLIDAYVMLAVAFLAVLLLACLLYTTLKGQVFSTAAARLLTAISWCCFLEALLSLLLIYYFQLAFCLAVAVGFIGLCLRIVRSVIEEATRIKSENDFTI